MDRQSKKNSPPSGRTPLLTVSTDRVTPTIYIKVAMLIIKNPERASADNASKRSFWIFMK
jgi:hypothetical protein